MLLVPKPRFEDLPLGHPSRTRRRTVGKNTVMPANDTFFSIWPQLHPANHALWDVEEAFPPYEHCSLPPNSRWRWPAAAVYIKETACYGARGVFSHPTVMENGDLLLGPCFEHRLRLKDDYCPWRTMALPYLGHRAKKEDSASEASTIQSSSSSSNGPGQASKAAGPSAPTASSATSLAAPSASPTTTPFYSTQSSRVGVVGGSSRAVIPDAGVPGTPVLPVVPINKAVQNAIDLTREDERHESRRYREVETDGNDARRKIRVERPSYLASLEEVHGIELTQLQERHESEVKALKKKHSEELDIRIRLADSLERATDADKQRLAGLQKSSQKKDGE